MTDYQDWINHDKLEFCSQDFGDINLTAIKAKPNADNFDFNTELHFDNCSIKSFNATVQVLGRLISFKDCKIGGIYCHAAYFFGGLVMENCVVNEPSTFDCGVHNQNPNEFVIDNCIFNGHLDFFDVYFEGPVRIINNNFRQGTSIALYLAVPYGIKEGLSFTLEANIGQLDKYADSDPFNNKKK